MEVEHVARSQEGSGVTGNPPHVHLLSHGARAAVAWTLVTIGLLAGAAQSERSPAAAAQAATPVARLPPGPGRPRTTHPGRCR